MNILVIDIGGTHIKLSHSAHPGARRKFGSGLAMTPQTMLANLKPLTEDWPYEAVSIGYPGAVLGGKPVHDPHNLAAGWVGFDFAGAFGCPLKLVNDAAMQALGNYQGGKLLFLGLGTGLGSALIVDGAIEPLELAHLPYKRGKTFEDYVGVRGLEQRGKHKWRKSVADVVERLRAALEPEEVVLGGGNAKLLEELPEGTRLGDDLAAFTGGFRLWGKLVA
ncbi:MAG: ROK family protein [Candidatus Thiothrix putei]|uniref:ROK family protein n=1 Tax=Candidatus Thiothrix putei TaxID=3080811 RepID=A0AA95HDM0_9GAMM|nr:MAG: ROK family protein [Candidatus Thiothrix putei]